MPRLIVIVDLIIIVFCVWLVWVLGEMFIKKIRLNKNKGDGDAK